MDVSEWMCGCMRGCVVVGIPFLFLKKNSKLHPTQTNAIAKSPPSPTQHTNLKHVVARDVRLLIGGNLRADGAGASGQLGELGVR